MSATMASTISRGILKQRRRSRDGTWYLPWRLGELITEKTDRMDPSPRHGCKCLLSGCEKGKCREVSQNMSERTSGPLWQVNRSNAFEISKNPWKHTDRAVYGYRLLQRCGCRPGSARNKSARSPRAMSHDPGSDICLLEVKGIHALSRGYNASVLPPEKDPWACGLAWQDRPAINKGAHHTAAGAW